MTPIAVSNCMVNSPFASASCGTSTCILDLLIDGNAAKYFYTRTCCCSRGLLQVEVELSLRWTCSTARKFALSHLLRIRRPKTMLGPLRLACRARMLKRMEVGNWERWA